MKKLTNDEFKERLVKVFGLRYGLSKVDYVNAVTKVCVICPEHGEFWSLPGNLLAGKGCPSCGYVSAAKKARRSVDEVIAKAIEVHGDKYDYSLFTEYKNNNTKFPIVCKEHGVFYQDYAHHVDRGHGCPKCAGNKKLSEEEIIEKAKRVWGDVYSYEDSHPSSTHSKMKIRCPEHGYFEMTPHDHINGRQGCPKCRYKRLWDSRGRMSVEEVKKQFEKVHGDEYDYSLFTEYKNNRSKVPIICKKHGVFYSTPNNHINGRGCPLCGNEKIGDERRLSVDEVIKRIKEVHGDRYMIPSDFEYKSNSEKVKLICPDHGEFWQVPFNLWRGVGCPKCNRSKLESEFSLFLERKGMCFEEQKKFDWLKNYELDFYLPEYNVAVECQGIQHFKPVKLFGGEEQFKKQVEWDREKKRLCEENGVKLLYFTNRNLMEKYNVGDVSIFSSKKELLKEIKE